MALRFEVDRETASRLVDGLLTAAKVEEPSRPLLAKKYIQIADMIGDELDRTVKVPSGWPYEEEGAE